MNFKLDITKEFVTWLSDTRDTISQIMSKLSTKENLSEKDELFLEDMHRLHSQL